MSVIIIRVSVSVYQTMSENIGVGAGDQAAGVNNHGGQNANEELTSAPAAQGEVGPAAQAPAAQEESLHEAEAPPEVYRVRTKTFDGAASTRRPSNVTTELPLTEFFIGEETVEDDNEDGIGIGDEA